MAHWISKPRLLRSLRKLEGYTVAAQDGDIGKVGDFLVDDEQWVVRYLVVQSGSLLHRHHVLITPVAFDEVDWEAQRFRLNLTKKQVEDSPSVDADKPVSRQHEREHFLYYGYPFYWGYAGLWGPGALPGELAEQPLLKPEHHARFDEAQGESHLRSVSELHGYAVEGSDDTIGHVKDFIVDEESWQIRYLVLDTSKLWFGESVLLPPRLATNVSFNDRTVSLDLERRAVRESPPWDPSQEITPAYEVALFEHYGQFSRPQPPAEAADAETSHHA